MFIKNNLGMLDTVLSTDSLTYSFSPTYNLSPTYSLSPIHIKETNPLTIEYPVINPFRTVMTTTPAIAITTPYIFEYDTGVGSNMLVQKRILKEFRYKMLDKWLYSTYSHLLKYLKKVGDKIVIVKNDKERDDNKNKDADANLLMLKSDFIHDNILTEEHMRKLLIRIIKDYGYRWTDLPHMESLVKDAMERYIRHKLKNMMEEKN